MSSGSNGLRGGVISQQAGRVFLTGRFQASHQCSFPFYRSSYELSILWHAPHSSCICLSASAALTSVDGTEEKGYEHLPPLNKSVSAHLCPPTAIGWKARASYPSKPCRATSALAGRDLLGWASSFSAVRKSVWMQLHSG